MKRRYRTRAAPKGGRKRPIRKGQRGQGFLSSLKKVANNPPVRQIGKTALRKAREYTSQLYNLGPRKTKNKTARKILQSNAATNLLKPCYKIREQVIASGNGITNIEIEKFFDDETNEDLKRNFMGVYSSDSVTRYINFYDIIKEKRAKYPFAIFNTDRGNKPGTHRWNFLDIHPKKDLLLFDSFGFVGFKQFIVDNDKNMIDKMLFNLEKLNKKDTKINLISLNFSIESYKKIKEKSLDNLTNTAKDFFHHLSEFGKLKKQNRKKMNIILLDDQLQELTAGACGIFQLYF